MSDKKKAIIGLMLGVLFITIPIGMYFLYNKADEPEEDVIVEEYNPIYIKTVMDGDSVETIGPSNIREDKIQAGPTPDSFTTYKIADFELRYKTYDVYYYEAAKGGSWEKYIVLDDTEKEHVENVVMREIDGEWVIDSDFDYTGKGEQGPYN